jgi:DUF4097 and DUF4098 domain-containing protein YvlB
MNEENMLILKMLGEGKITAEQADALLRAVRQTAPPPPPPVAPIPPVPPPPPAPSVDPAALASMQKKLGELQNKLGDLQGKIGAAQAARAAGQAVSFAGKVLDHIPRPDVDFSKINKTFDEAMKGLSSLKNDAVRTAKVTGRQAAHEARRAARQGRKSMKFDLNFQFGEDRETGRPQNNGGQAQAQETSDSTVSWTGASSISLANDYGSIKVIGDEAMTGDSVQAKVTKTAWGGSESDARVLLQQIFLTGRVENGKCRVEIVAPSDAKDRVTVDYEIRIPRALALEVETTFGEIEAEEVSAILTTSTISGSTTVRRPLGDTPGEAHLESRSGEIRLEGWNAPESQVSVETTSGDITGDGLTCRKVALSSRSGDVTLTKIQTLAEADFESVSGDVSVTGGSVGTRLAAKTQSGDLSIASLRSEQMSVETVSGDAHLREVTGALAAKTISGDIDAEAIQSPAVSLATVSGDAHWAFAAPFSGSLAGTTVSGDLTVALWTNSDTRVEMSTTSGDLDCDLQLADRSPENSRHLSGKLGDGIGSIKLQSVSGDLRVEAEAS